MQFSFYDKGDTVLLSGDSHFTAYWSKKCGVLTCLRITVKIPASLYILQFLQYGIDHAPVR